MKLTDAQTDRALGAVVGAAVGDALGAGYEFNHASSTLVPAMIGGGLGPFEPGEWTDDTSLTWGVLEAASLYELKSDEGLDRVAASFYAWYKGGPPDIGGTTASSLSAGPSREAMVERAAWVDGYTNGSLMRTAPVAVAYLNNPADVALVADRVSALTHASLDAREACMMWSLGIYHAIWTGDFDLSAGLRYMPEDSREYWIRVCREAEERGPMNFSPNSSAVRAYQASWSSIVHTPEQGFVDTLTTAIRIGHDTDTVASITGALLGARWGLSAIPSEWVDILHGYPGKTAQDLVDLTRVVLTRAIPE